MMRWLLAAMLTVGLWLPGSAQAGEADIYKTISGKDIQRLLLLAGVESVISQDQAGNPLVFAQSGETKFVVRTFDCQAAGADTNCRRLQYRAGFELPTPPSRDSMNDFNRTWVFGKAYVTENGLAAIEYPVNLTLGVTEANLVHNFVLWVAILEEFITHIGSELTS
jgi:hypothetical protein